ncbi:MAG: SMP-30/gluconolactonase/LRE family protein [Fimbriimonas sp.]
MITLALLTILAQAEFRAIVAEDAKLEQVSTGYKFTEGAAWLRDGSLIWSDIPANTIYRLKAGDLSVFRKPSNNSNGNVVDIQGRLVTCEHGTRRVTRTEKDGTIKVLAERFEGKRLNSPNDVVVHANGTVYFTDPPYGISRAQEELGFAATYQLTPDGKLSLVSKDFRKPNGIALSPDQRTLYVADTEGMHIKAFTVFRDGSVSPRARLFAEVKGDRPGAPDGMRVDVKGNVYCTGSGGIHIFSATGKPLGIIAVPEVATNCAWGDRDARALYITAQSSIYKIRLKIPGLRY